MNKIYSTYLGKQIKLQVSECVNFQFILISLRQYAKISERAKSPFCYNVFFSEIFRKINLRYQPLPTYRPFKTPLQQTTFGIILAKKKKLLNIFIFYGEFVAVQKG